MTKFPTSYLYQARALLIRDGLLPAGPPTRTQLDALARVASDAGTVGQADATAKAWAEQ